MAAGITGWNVPLPAPTYGKGKRIRRLGKMRRGRQPNPSGTRGNKLARRMAAFAKGRR